MASVDASPLWSNSRYSLENTQSLYFPFSRKKRTGSEFLITTFLSQSALIRMSQTCFSWGDRSISKF